MEKRVLVAVFLSFLVLYAYQALFVKPAPETTSTASPAGGPPSTTTTPSAVTGTPAEDTSAPPQAAPAPSVPALVSEPGEHDVTVETDMVQAVFSNRGGVLKSWRLKRFTGEDGHPLELIPTGLPPETSRPFSLDLGDRDLSARLDRALFKVTAADASRLVVREASTPLTFDFEDTSGLRASKRFVFDPASYILTFKATVSNGGTPIDAEVRWGPALGDVGNTGEASRYIRKPGGILFQDGKVHRVNPSQIAKQPTYEGVMKYAGVDDHYFLSATIEPGPVKVQFGVITLPATDKTTHELVSYQVRYQEPGTEAKFFVGPKDFDVLAAVDRDFVRSIDYGMFAFLVVPLLRSLKWINTYVGNFGWSIIILTILINAAMFPLRHKSVVSMRKMQELQPEVKAIQDRYAKLKTTDPAKQKMNVELMNLYRERGVNPASGCVPMLLTMPVLLAFYSLLSQSIEIRGAPFMLWITDLSRHDPLYVTPILMGATMVVQQRMTPSTADPAQQKMMMFMPIVFTFMFLWAPSGLVLYWLVSNLWAIGQQQITNRLIGPPVVRVVRPAAERQLKRAGAGKTDGAKSADKQPINGMAPDERRP